MIIRIKKPYYQYIIERNIFFIPLKNNCNINIIRFVKKNYIIKKNKVIRMIIQTKIFDYMIYSSTLYMLVLYMKIISFLNNNINYNNCIVIAIVDLNS